MVRCIITTKGRIMNEVENIEGRIKALSPQELTAFREWFIQFDAEAWDRKLDADANDGKLNRLAERALRDYAAGRSTKL